MTPEGGHADACLTQGVQAARPMAEPSCMCPAAHPACPGQQEVVTVQLQVVCDKGRARASPRLRTQHAPGLAWLGAAVDACACGCVDKASRARPLTAHTSAALDTKSARELKQGRTGNIRTGDASGPRVVRIDHAWNPGVFGGVLFALRCKWSRRPRHLRTQHQINGSRRATLRTRTLLPACSFVL